MSPGPQVVDVLHQHNLSWGFVHPAFVQGVEERGSLNGEGVAAWKRHRFDFRATATGTTTSAAAAVLAQVTQTNGGPARQGNQQLQSSYKQLPRLNPKTLLDAPSAAWQCKSHSLPRLN